MLTFVFFNACDVTYAEADICKLNEQSDSSSETWPLSVVEIMKTGLYKGTLAKL